MRDDANHPVVATAGIIIMLKTPIANDIATNIDDNIVSGIVGNRFFLFLIHIKLDFGDI